MGTTVAPREKTLREGQARKVLEPPPDLLLDPTHAQRGHFSVPKFQTDQQEEERCFSVQMIVVIIFAIFPKISPLRWCELVVHSCVRSTVVTLPSVQSLNHPCCMVAEQRRGGSMN